MNASDFNQALFSYIANKVAPSVGFGGSILVGVLYKSKIGALHQSLQMLGIEDAMGVIDVAKLREGLDGALLFVQQPLKDLLMPHLDGVKQLLITMEKKVS